MSILTDATVGAVIGHLLTAVLRALEKAAMFHEALKTLEFTIRSMAPIAEKMKELNKSIDLGNEEIKVLWKQIEEGKELIRRCSEITWCCAWLKKACYTKKLQDLDNSLRRFHQLVIPMLVIETFEGVRVILEEVEEINEQSQNIYEKVEQVGEKLTDIDKKLQSLNPIAALRPCVPPEPPEFTVGLDGPLRELKEELFKDWISAVVLSAPGGCGKTTLAKRLCQDEDIQGKFKDCIFFVTVSKTPNLKVIVQQLLQHGGYQVPEFQSDEDAVNRLEQLLKQTGPKPVLLVLDDVWPGSESLLDKLKFQIPDYKILVTSRSTFPGFGSTYKLDTLNAKDSMSLLCHSAGMQDGRPHNVDGDVVDKVVKACKGLPLALTVMGRSLRGQPAAIWHNRVQEWSKGASIFKSNAELLNCLKSSLDALDDEVLKECYMDLGSFPEAQLIPAAALIDMWVELHELDENGLNSIAKLHELSALSLVDLVITRKDASEVEGYYNEHFVMQHDLLRELVNHLSELNSVEQRKRLIVDVSGDRFPKWWTEQKQQHVNARLLSISTDERFLSNWLTMQADEVEVLVLNFCNKNYTLPEFITDMGKMRALILTNYGFFPAEISNFSVLGDLSNLKRIRLEQVLIPSLTLASVQLKNLQKISLFMCKIDQGFGDSNFQIFDALPSLVEIDIGHCINLVKLPIGLCDILQLKKLSITYCNELSKLPKEIGKLEKLEVLRLCFCINLLELPETIGSLYNLDILDISDCRSIGHFPDQISGLRNLRKLYMTGCSKCELPQSIIKLRHLKNVICDAETAKSWKPFFRYFSDVKIEALEM